MLSRCGRACAAFRARLKRAARCGSTAVARQRSCQQDANPLQSALEPCVEALAALAAARNVDSAAAKLDFVPSKARRARPHRCGMHTSACKCKSVQWSCLCSAMEVCVGVCAVGTCARVLARACARVLRRRCRMSLPAPETARPFPSCRTTGRSPRARGHPPWWAIHRSFFCHVTLNLRAT